MEKETRILFGKKNYLLGTDKENKKVWEDRGFKRIRKYPIFHYTP